jgi:hypothetical protein
MKADQTTVIDCIFRFRSSLIGTGNLKLRKNNIPPVRRTMNAARKRAKEFRGGFS